MNYETIIGLAIVALNAGVAAVLGESGLQMNPIVHASLVAISAASGAVLLYIRPAMRAGELVQPHIVQPMTMVQPVPQAVVQATEYPN